MATWYENEELLRSLGDLGMGLLANSGPSTDPSHASFGSALGKGMMQMSQGAAARRAEARENRRLQMEESAIQAKRDEILRKAAEMQNWRNRLMGGEQEVAGPPMGGVMPTKQVAPAVEFSKLPIEVRLALASMEPGEGAKQLSGLMEMSKPEPMMLAPYKGPVMASTNKLGEIRRVEGAAPLPKIGQANLSDKTRLFDEYTGNPIADWAHGLSQNTKYQVDNPPMAAVTLPGGVLATMSTRGMPQVFPAMPGKGVSTFSQDQPPPMNRPSVPVTATGTVAAQESVPAAVTDKLVTGQSLITAIDKAIADLEKNPTAIGVKGFLPDTALKYMDPAGVATRAQIADVGSLKIVERSGATVPVGEMQRVAPFIPSVSDKPQVAIDKLKRLREVQQEELNEYKKQYRTIADSPNALVPMDQAKPGQLYIAPDGSTRRKK